MGKSGKGWSDFKNQGKYGGGWVWEKVGRGDRILKIPTDLAFLTPKTDLFFLLG